MMQQMMNSPMMDAVLNDPSMLQNMMNSNPQMQAMMNANPQIRQMMNDPAVRLCVSIFCCYPDTSTILLYCFLFICIILLFSCVMCCGKYSSLDNKWK